MIRRLRTLPPIRWLIDAWDRADTAIASALNPTWEDDE